MLKQCGDELTRANVTKQAASLKNIRLPMLIATQQKPGGLLHDKLSKPGVEAAASAASGAGRWSVSDRHHPLMPLPIKHDLGGLRACAAWLWLGPAPAAGPRQGPVGQRPASWRGPPILPVLPPVQGSDVAVPARQRQSYAAQVLV